MYIFLLESRALIDHLKIKLVRWGTVVHFETPRKFKNVPMCEQKLTSPLSSLPWNFFFPAVQGTYLCLIICLSCLFIVIMKSIIKYMTKIGQNTGTLKSSKKVHVNATIVARVAHHQNYSKILLTLIGKGTPILNFSSSRYYPSLWSKMTFICTPKSWKPIFVSVRWVWITWLTEVNRSHIYSKKVQTDKKWEMS